mmetsp:Transcript_96612/g.176940  ORF Transcript_96612/g.176940 Transcript_96612/m.176940 type:complete len:224 (+) Transcript_96612:216-887(+)
MSGQRELNLSNVTDSHSVLSTIGGCNDGTEGSGQPILGIHTHLARGVIRSLPELNICIKRTAISGQNNLHMVNHAGAVRPGLEGSSLHKDGVLANITSRFLRSGYCSLAYLRSCADVRSSSSICKVSLPRIFSVVCRCFATRRSLGPGRRHRQRLNKPTSATIPRHSSAHQKKICQCSTRRGCFNSSRQPSLMCWSLTCHVYSTPMACASQASQHNGKQTHGQ